MTLDPLTAYVGAFVDELSNTVDDVVISPGSRSTPLAILFAQHPEIRVWLNVDERSAAFFALGIAKAKQRPVALVCTSGTAAANYYPAVIEAHESRLPLLVLTADRPHELRDVSAPQAIDQIHLYGQYVKWFHDMALPENDEQMLRYVRTIAARSSGTANSGKKGPVHLNFPLREPLVPDYRNEEVFSSGKIAEAPSACLHSGKKGLDEQSYHHVRRKCSGVERGLIVCGPGEYKDASEAIVELAEALQFPILADPLSPMRYGDHPKEAIIENHDALLKTELVREWKPELIIRFGAMPVSKPYLQYIKTHSGCNHVIVDEGDGWREPAHLGGDMLHVDPELFSKQMLDGLESCDVESNWFIMWKKANEICQQVKHEFLEKVTDPFEGKVFSELEKLLAVDVSLFVGNSMPIRDLDTFFGKTRNGLSAFANRGANGIDGVVSSALGVAAARGRTVLVIGDLSFYHDMNGLLASRLHDLDVTIVLINNSGGGIFSFLPQSKHEDHFEHLFGTPIGIQFEQAVGMYGGTYRLTEDWDTFNAACRESFNSKGLSVIEIQTDRAENVEMHQRYWREVQDALSKWWMKNDTLYQ